MTSGRPVQATTVAPRVKTPHPYRLREVEVVGVRTVAPRMVRVTVGGPQLADLVSLGPTGHAKVYFPDPVTGVLTAPTQAEDGSNQLPGEAVVHVRDYTVRALRPDGPDGPEADLDLVMHGGSGPASIWAGRAAEGDRLVLGGPKSSKLVPDAVADVLLGCDETALPAVARWLELLPAGVAVRVLAEVDSRDDEVYLAEGHACRSEATIQWLHRTAAARDGGTDGHTGAEGRVGLLEAAVRRDGSIGPGTFVWFGGEARSLVGVRRYLRRELGLGAGQVEMTGYWRRGQAAFDHHAPIDPKDPD